jgi:hypothetical protein
MLGFSLKLAALKTRVISINFHSSFAFQEPGRSFVGFL